MNPFKVGDIVLCVSSKPGYNMNGQLYRVNKIYDNWAIGLEGFNEHERFAATRFQLHNATSSVHHIPKPIIELNRQAKQATVKRPAFSRLPVYRAVRKKITDDAERSTALHGLKREYKQAENIEGWKRHKQFSSFFVFSDTPEGGDFWQNIRVKINT